MKRWKLLTVLAIIVLMSVAATKVPYISRAGIESHEVAVDSAGDSTYFYDTTVFKVAGFNYLSYRVIFVATSDSLLGAWVEDTINIRLDFLRNGVWVEQMSSTKADASGDTLTGVVLKAVGDTAINEWARLVIYYADTISDTTATMTYDITIDFFGKVSP